MDLAKDQTLLFKYQKHISCFLQDPDSAYKHCDSYK